MKAILITLLMVAISFAQINVKTVPQAHEFTSIFAGIVGADGDGIDTTTAISTKQWANINATLCIESDTTGASVDAAQQSDSCLTIGVQFYCGETNAAGWGAYYNNKDTYKSVAEFTTLDTLDRAYVNVAAGRHFIDLNASSEWIFADSVRFFLIIGAADSLTVNAAIGGQ